MRPSALLCAFALVAATPACGGADGDEEGADTRAGGARTATGGAAEVLAGPEERMSPDQVERGRNDPSWRRFVPMDSAADGGPGASDETLDQIGAERMSSGDLRYPVREGMEGPSVLAAQVLLDRARFSPGILDGRWGKNTEKAVYWFQRSQGLPGTGVVDQETLGRLREAAGATGELVEEHTLTSSDVEGPFVTIPEDIYEQAELDCMCYESLEEKLAELFHATPDLLQRLNPGVDLNGVAAGDRLLVPAVTSDASSPPADVAALVVSDGGHYVHAVDAGDRVLYHFPSTLGSQYAPSPSGDFAVKSIHHDPMWHYQPDLLTGVPDDEEDAMIPAGPNNAVGIVWMALTKDHYGIHGTSAPETIGYATSHGCVRLTNWDARLLAERIDPGVPVRFIDGS